MRTATHVVWLVFRLLAVWVVDVLSLSITAAVTNSISFRPVGDAGVLTVIAATAFLLGLVNLLLRPLVLLLMLPLGYTAIFVVGLLANGLGLLITSALLPGFDVAGVGGAVVAAVILAAANTLLTSFVTFNDQGSFYQGVVERLARRQVFQGAGEPGRGLVMLEIDGLSYWHLQRALEKGLLPTMAEMLRSEGYALSRFECGLPSQTSACQSGILFGDNFDIPAFRWYEKERRKLMVSGKDAAEINARFARGQGLLRGGSSINNMLNGDAEKSLLTLADLRTGSRGEQQRRAMDIYFLMVNPYFMMRTLVLALVDASVEVGQGLVQRLSRKEPRLNRLERLYPLVRATAVVLMRDVAAYLAALDIIRGAPAIYLTWPGYDEVAHHSGPWSNDAFGVLKKYDRVIWHVRDIIRRKAPRAYDLIILSDHGQSFGATFKQRYGYDLKQFIESHMPQGTGVVQTAGGDDGTIALAAMAGELANIQDQRTGGPVSRAVLRQGQRALDQGAAVRSEPEPAADAPVTVCGSGNLAVVYFGFEPRKITLGELQAVYPGLVDALVGHDGIGFVVGYGDGCVPQVLGKAGRRNLHTGEISGQDPLARYGDPGLRAAQVRRLADYPHAGDLIVISSLFPDGTVAAMEELIGSHGGLGGEQTDAFLFHPVDMAVPPTQNAADVYHILNARRGSPVIPRPAVNTRIEDPAVWAPAALWAGLTQFRVWARCLLGALLLRRVSYRAVAVNPAMTGPALLIALSCLELAALDRAGVWQPIRGLAWFAVWLAGVALVTAAARLLGGQHSLTRTLRALGFACSLTLFGLLGWVPMLAPTVNWLTLVLMFVASWLAAIEAQDLRGWRGLMLPVVGFLLPIVLLAIAVQLYEGAAYMIGALLQRLGSAP